MILNEERLRRGIEDPENKEDVLNIVEAAILLMAACYEHDVWDQEKIHGPLLFMLRKRLEGIWGHSDFIRPSTEDYKL